MSPTTTIAAAIARRALDHVLHPPGGDDPVIEFASPQQLADVFAGSVGLDVADDEPAHTDADVMAAIDDVIRYSMHTNHPRFVNQNFAGADPLAVVGDWLGAALNTTGATYEAAPVFTLMEHAVLDKLGRLAGYVPTDRRATDAPLPPGMFCPGGSTATLYALQLARHRRQPDLPRLGAGPERLVLFVSAAGHYAAAKSAALLGLGTDAVVEVAADDDGAIVPSTLDTAIVEAVTRGDTPFAVIGTAGTTVTAAFDDLDALADVCERHDLWLHVDGCYGGSALFSEREAHRLAGVERSDSFVWNLHKMMGMTQQCTVLLVRDPSQLGACFSTGADYLFQPDKLFADHDSGDRTFQCARRIDVLKLWLAWKARGDTGFAARIDHAVAMADHARGLIARSDGAFVPLVAGSFTNVVFVWVPPDLRPLLDRSRNGFDTATRDRLHLLAPRIKATLQRSGSAMIGFQPVHGVNAFRLICMNPDLGRGDVDAILGAIDAAGHDA